jgi:hypothetical protein
MRNRHLAALVAAAALALGIAGPVSAHPHVSSVAHQGDGQTLANGQNHGPFVSGVTCGGDPAAYGLETAHHGPDAGDPGRSDGCYMTTGGVAPGADVANPVIR